MYEFRDTTGQSDSRFFLGWSGVSYLKTGLSFYLSDERISGMDPDASAGLHRVEGVGVVRYIGTVTDAELLRSAEGYALEVKGLGSVTVRVVRKFLFEKLVVTVDGTGWKGREVLGRPF
jgi:energy-converting hydrogenase Eha subunit G